MDAHRTDFAVSVDAAQGVTTGISAADRTQTIRIIGDPRSKPGELARPGHVFPLRARPGGVLERPGHTEAAVDLAILAGLHPSGVLCELMNDDGTVARLGDIVEFKRRFGLRHDLDRRPGKAPREIKLRIAGPRFSSRRSMSGDSPSPGTRRCLRLQDSHRRRAVQRASWWRRSWRASARAAVRGRGQGPQRRRVVRVPGLERAAGGGAPAGRRRQAGRRHRPRGHHPGRRRSISS